MPIFVNNRVKHLFTSCFVQSQWIFICFGFNFIKDKSYLFANSFQVKPWLLTSCGNFGPQQIYSFYKTSIAKTKAIVFFFHSLVVIVVLNTRWQHLLVNVTVTNTCEWCATIHHGNHVENKKNELLTFLRCHDHTKNRIFDIIVHVDNTMTSW
jgi:hypothetical protein